MIEAQKTHTHQNAHFSKVWFWFLNFLKYFLSSFELISSSYVCFLSFKIQTKIFQNFTNHQKDFSKIVLAKVGQLGGRPCLLQARTVDRSSGNWGCARFWSSGRSTGRCCGRPSGRPTISSQLSIWHGRPTGRLGVLTFIESTDRPLVCRQSDCFVLVIFKMFKKKTWKVDFEGQFIPLLCL